MTDILAIDPGAISGAYAFFAGGRVTVGDLPAVDGQLDAAAFARLVMDELGGVDVAVVERVGAMPKQGVASTFKFGMAVGLIHGVLLTCDIPLELVTAGVWKKSFSLAGRDKEAARALAIRLYPGLQGLERKRDQNRAEALLIGRWYINKQGVAP